MSAVTLRAGGTTLPSPTEMSIDDELIWTSDSGRDLSGLFSGDVIAQKKTVSLTWGILTQAEVVTLQTKLCPGYFPLVFTDASGEISIEGYRGTLSKQMLGYIGDGVFYYRSVSVTFVEK